ncbi:unnamed protein product [Tuber aestivum]|uniref:Large ribosomal subunit protein uL2m n=1 Tax=Tuber aestivum TaxID=59557 RepID=A0A292PMJ3_9PEZI|nr:unnamed protein product [Tuber aestivum]
MMFQPLLSRTLLRRPIPPNQLIDGRLHQLQALARLVSTTPKPPASTPPPAANPKAPNMSFVNTFTARIKDDSRRRGSRATTGSSRNLRMRTYKPRTPGLRHLKRPIEDHLWKKGPFRPLTFTKKGTGGRNHTGRITCRHRGGGHKRRIRTVDFHRISPGPHTIDRIERDPGRSAHIALVTNNTTGRKSYILAADGLRAGDTVQSYRDGIPDDLMAAMGGRIDPGMLAARTTTKGNCLPMHMIPIGSVVFGVGSKEKGGAVFCRAAGTYATVVAREPATKSVIVKMQSGEVRRVSKFAAATMGVASNTTWQHRQLGKAGRSRNLGIRPTVRGVAMNACDHPHGGGRGKSQGDKAPVSPWGIPTKAGYKTRPRGKPNKYVVTPRARNHGKRKNKN